MSEQYTESQVKQHCIAVMGQELGVLYSLLSNECAWLHLRWNEYKAMFGDKPERIELMNEAASMFFWFVQQSFWEDTLLHICRLSDPEQS